MSSKSATIDPVDTKATGKPRKGAHTSNRVLALGAEPPGHQRIDHVVDHAAMLFETDQTRFQRYLGLMKNFVMIPFRSNKNTAESGSRDGKQSASKSARDKAKIATVAKALDKYGDDQLSRLHDTGQLDNIRDTGLRSAEIRDPYAQQKIRDASTSKHKDKKEAAHFAGLDVVCKMNEKLPPQHRMAADAMKKAFNQPSNFTMALRSTNDPSHGLHGVVDQKIVQALNGQEVTLTRKEKKRVVQIVKFCQKKEFQSFMVENGGDQLYAKFRATIKSIDSKLWDARHDQRELQDPTVTAHLKADGSPDRRYKENKAPRESDLRPRDSKVAPTLTPRKKDGTPDRRYRGAKTEPATSETSIVASPAPSAPLSSAHLKKDGTPDQRFADNRQEHPPAPAIQPLPASAATTPPIATATARASSPSLHQPLTASSVVSTSATSARASREVLTGPRGGTYYLNSNGNKTYMRSLPAASAVSVVPSSAYSAPSYPSSSSAADGGGGGGGRQTFTGPRGGTYYINSSGTKSYCR